VKTLREYLQGNRGATAVEFALLALPFVILIIGLIEFGRALHIRSGLDTAADRAQRLILIDPNSSLSTITTGARAAFHIGDPENLSVDLQTGTSGSITYRSIELAYTMTLLIPITGGADIVLSTSRKVALID